MAVVDLWGNLNDHLDEVIDALLAGLRDATLTPDGVPSVWSIEYLDRLQSHLDALMMHVAKRRGRSYVAIDDLTDDQNRKYNTIKHHRKILDALYGPQEG